MKKDMTDMWIKNTEEIIETLEDICKTAAGDRYGPILPYEVEERLKFELLSADRHNLAGMYLFWKKLSDRSRELGYEPFFRRNTGTSFIAYLCGISDINPLRPHYHCPNCHYFEAQEKNPMDIFSVGYDLSPKRCPKCSEMMETDGFNIPYETFYREGQDKRDEIIIDFAPDIQAKIIEYAVRLIGKEEVSFNRPILNLSTDAEMMLSASRICIPGTDSIEKLKELEEKTGIKQKDIPYKDDNVLEFIKKEGDPGPYKSFSKELLEKVKPESFSDIMRLIMLSHLRGYHKELPSKLIEHRSDLPAIPAGRDDIYLYLSDIGMAAETALDAVQKITERDETGKKDICKKMKAAGVPQWYTDFYNDTFYMPAKTYTASNAKHIWKFAFYGCYFPEIYRKVIRQ